MATKTTPDGNPNIGRDPGDKDWEEKTARYDGHRSDQDSPYVTPKQAKELHESVYGSGSQEEIAEREQAATELGSSDDLGTRESTGDAGWTTDVEGETSGQTRNIFTKKRGLWALIALVTTSAGIIMAGIITPAITIVNLKEVAVHKFSKITNSISDKRGNRIMIKKLSKKITRGCSILSPIKCRYKGMSTREIDKFNRRNASEGWRIESRGRSKLPPFKNQVELQKISGEGANVKVERVVDASEVKTTLRKDPSLQKAFRNFNKGIVTFWADSTARSTWKKFKIKLFKRAPEEGKGKTEEEKRIYRTNQEVTDVETDGKGHARTSPAGLEGDTSEYVNDRADQLSNEANDPSKVVPPEPDVTNPPEVEKVYGSTASKIEHASPGIIGDIANPIAAAIYPYCITKDLSKSVFNLRKTLITIQLIRYAINFARLADQIKSGNAGADTTQEIGDMTSILTSKDAFGFTAFDSFGYNWAAYGKLGSHGPNEDITKYQTGGGPPGFLGKTVSAVTGIIPQGACDIANNFFLNLGLLIVQVGAAIATFGGSALEEEAGQQAAQQGLKSAIEYVAKVAIKKTVEDVTKNKLKSRFLKEFAVLTLKIAGPVLFFHYAVPPMIGLIARAITGTTVTGGTHGLDAGNAAISGFGAAGAASGRAHGFAFLNKTDAVSSDQSASAYDKHLAKIGDVNQLSLTDPNSFATKLAMATLPYTSQLSFAGMPTTLASFSLGSLGALGDNASLQAADDSAQYDMCKDSTYEDLGIAVGPFCNPVAGMPTNTIESSSTDPTKVINYMLGHHYINGKGNPRPGDYQNFLDKCPSSNDPLTDGDGICADPNNMKEPDKTKYIMFHYYTIDSGVNSDMEDGDTGSSGSGSPGPPAGFTIDMAHLYDSSVSVSCAAGTKDLGIQDGYNNGNKIKIRICAIPNLPSTGEESNGGYGVTGANGDAVVNSRISGAVLALVKAAKSDGIPMAANSSFRTMAHQQALWAANPDPTYVAPPGTSNHQMGLAIDYTMANSAKFNDSHTTCVTVNGRCEAPGDKVWEWLNNNANNFGFKQYVNEYWHWSPTGN